MNLRAELTKIYKQEGRLTPRVLVEAARPTGHPLHDAIYDVPPKLAAERYYLNRAHELIQSVKIVYRDPKTSKPYDIRAWHAIRDDAGHHVYKPTDEVVNDPILRALVLKEMERDWRELHARYGQFVEFLDLVKKDLKQTA